MRFETGQKFRIGAVVVQPNVVVAPMAGYTDLAYRLMVKELGGAGMAYTELISCHSLVHLQPQVQLMIATAPADHPLGMQIFGADVERMAASASLLEEYGADVIDINMGCPVSKVVKTGGGAVLMRDPERAEAIVQACVAAISIPVTVKIRAGWDDQSRNAVEFARRMVDAGAAAVAVHARTRAQGYAGRADWSVIRAVAEAVAVPVIGNGDVADGPSARALLDETGCAGVMIGRAAMGAPWLFRSVSAFLASGVAAPEPSAQARGHLAQQHLSRLCALYGEATACLHIRRIACCYARGLVGVHEFRKNIVRVTSAADAHEIIVRYFALAQQHEDAHALHVKHDA